MSEEWLNDVLPDSNDIHWEQCRRNVDRLKEYFTIGNNLEQENNAGMTCLEYWAMMWRLGYPELRQIFNFLLDKDAKADHQNKYTGSTALHVLVRGLFSDSMSW